MVELPSFDAPPVVEMALGVQFASVAGLRGLELYPLWSRWRDQYPKVEEQPSLPPSTEVDQSSGIPTVQLSLSTATPRVRYWFLSDAGSNLIQVQHDRLVVNWRRGDESGLYPRYQHMRNIFRDKATEFENFLAETSMGKLRINQAEVSYINAIEAPGDKIGQLDQLLRNWSNLSSHHLGEAEEARAAMIFRLPDIGQGPARLHVGVDPAVRSDGVRVIFLTLTAQGAPRGETLKDALDFMDAARGHVVQSFAELTSESMHTEWGRTR